MIHSILSRRIWSLLAALTLLPASLSTIHAADVAPKTILRPDHIRSMDDWGKTLRTLLRALETPEQDKETLEGVTAMRSLIDLPRIDMAEAEPLAGSWRVRSLQVNNLGAYLYPFFTCKITQKNGNFEFHRATGSQRKFGMLKREDADHYIFAGAVYYDYEKPRNYSTTLSNPTEEDQQRDSIGHLYKLGKNHYLLVFAVDQGGGELYEIKK